MVGNFYSGAVGPKFAIWGSDTFSPIDAVLVFLHGRVHRRVSTHLTGVSVAFVHEASKPTIRE